MGGEHSSEADRRLAKHLIDHGMASPEQVEECLRERQRLASEGVLPLPGLEELLRRKGYLQAQAVVETVRLAPGAPPSRAATPPSGMPAAAARADTDPANRFGKYIRDSKLGAGGAGEVWRAWDKALGRWVALKFLKSEDPNESVRFQREAQTAAKLAHPNIAVVYEVGDQDGRPYIAMQYIRGRTLAAIPRAQRRLLVELVRDAARAVHYAHEQGVVHRDLKPHNLMAEATADEGTRPRLYVMDFGLSKQTSVDSSLSMSGMILGTPSYMSPEQAQGRAKEVGPRTDVYGLGATLYDLLAGRPPHVDTEVYALLRKIVDDEPPPLGSLDPTIDPDLRTIVAKCLEKDPVRRYASAQELADDLDRYLGGDLIIARPTTMLYRTRKWIQKRRALTAALAAIVLLAAGGAAYLTLTGVRRAAEMRALDLCQQATGHANEARVIWRVKSARREQWETLFDRAVEKANRAIKEDPDLARAHATLGEILEARGKWREAIPAFDRALEIDPTLAEAWYGRGLCHLELYMTGLVQSAAMRQGATGMPEVFDTDRGRVAPLKEKTLRDLRRYTELRGEAGAETLEVRIARAAFALADGKYADAERICDEILKEDRTDERVWLFKTLCQAGQGRLLNAAVSLQHQIEAAPNQGRAYVARGFLRGQLGNRAAGVADLNRAVELEPENPEVRLLAGVARATLGDWKGALGDHDRAVALDPGTAANWISRAWVRAGLQDWKGCLEDAEKGIALDPDAAKGHWFRGWAKNHFGELPEALRSLTRAAELDPKNVAVLTDLASVRARQGDVKGCRQDCHRAVELAPDDQRAYVILTQLCRKDGSWQRGLEDAERIFKRGFGRAETHFFRGRCHLELGKPAAALKDFQKATELTPRLRARTAPLIARCRKALNRK